MLIRCIITATFSFFQFSKLIYFSPKTPASRFFFFFLVSRVGEVHPELKQAFLKRETHLESKHTVLKYCSGVIRAPSLLAERARRLVGEANAEKTPRTMNSAFRHELPAVSFRRETVHIVHPQVIVIQCFQTERRRKQPRSTGGKFQQKKKKNPYRVQMRSDRSRRISKSAGPEQRGARRHTDLHASRIKG